MVRSEAHETSAAPEDSASTPQPNHPETHLSRAPGVHADLQAVITAWPTLSEAIRATILRLIQEGEVQR
jgi:hypothetical protein